MEYNFPVLVRYMVALQIIMSASLLFPGLFRKFVAAFPAYFFSFYPVALLVYFLYLVAYKF